MGLDRPFSAPLRLVFRWWLAALCVVARRPPYQVNTTRYRLDIALFWVAIDTHRLLTLTRFLVWPRCYPLRGGSIPMPIFAKVNNSLFLFLGNQVIEAVFLHLFLQNYSYDNDLSYYL